ncbi:MAG: Bro-N domain-containing protein [Paludibacteraceae bacterium]|nr:Bro-N domain-containing protein [Paludibacteraceae bacterium]
MAQEEIIKLFDAKQIRVVWDDEKEKYFFSVVDVIQALTDSAIPRRYWSDLKRKLSAEGSEVYEKIVQLKLTAPDGKQRLTDVADTEQVLRLIQSIPSKKAEPLKLWLAQVGQERLNQLQDPERSIEQAIKDYRRLGYSETWINQRIKTIEIRKGLTDEWKRSGVEMEQEYASLTDIMYRAWSGLNTREYKKLKGLRKESLRDNMTNVELMLNGLAEAAATEISQERNPQGYIETASVAQEGGEVADAARQNLEQRIGRSVISSKRAAHFINPPDELPLPKEKDELDELTDL